MDLSILEGCNPEATPATPAKYRPPTPPGEIPCAAMAFCIFEGSTPPPQPGPSTCTPWRPAAARQPLPLNAGPAGYGLKKAKSLCSARG